MTTIVLIPDHKYTRKEVGEFLELTPQQLKIAEDEEYLFFGGKNSEYMYGVYLFQFMRNNGDKLQGLRS